MSAKSVLRTCRHCLGTGCIHCQQRGQVRLRVWERPADKERSKEAQAVLAVLRGDRYPVTG